MNERLTILKQQIEYWSNPINKTNKILEVIQLYFDNFEVPNMISEIIQSKTLKNKFKNKKSIIIDD